MTVRKISFQYQTVPNISETIYAGSADGTAIARKMRRSDAPSSRADSWGASAGDSPWGYDVSGATPALLDPKPNGTVSIYGAVSSLPFVPDQVIEMIAYLHREHPQTWGKYGFFDSYNIAVDPPWYSSAIYGIDKGCSMIMIENYLSGLVWNTYTGAPSMQRALHVLGFQKRA